MDGNAPLSLAEQFSAVQEWWREAGVDCAFAEEPVCWLRDDSENPEKQATPPVPERSRPEPPAKPTIGGTPDRWPGDIDTFREWWMAEPSLDACGGAGPRIPPRGKRDACVMILIPAPEVEDGPALLSGPQGRLLTGFLSAAGLKEDECYFASSLPRHAALADLPALAEAGLSAITMHHITLVNPARLMIFGRSVLPLIGHDPAQNRATLELVNHEKRRIPVFVSRNLELMLQRPATRSRFWQRWLGWTG